MGDNIRKLFESKVVRKGKYGCHIWAGEVLPNGYGRFKANGKRKLAHRVAYELYVGPIQNGDEFRGTCVCHKCDNPRCVNPDHLFLGTASDNARDKIEKGRGVDNSGIKHGMVKLTEAEVKEIKSLLKAGVNQYILADKYHVHQSSISHIKNGKNWSHL